MSRKVSNSKHSEINQRIETVSNICLCLLINRIKLYLQSAWAQVWLALSTVLNARLFVKSKSTRQLFIACASPTKPKTLYLQLLENKRTNCLFRLKSKLITRLSPKSINLQDWRSIQTIHFCLSAVVKASYFVSCLLAKSSNKTRQCSQPR